MQVCLGYLTYKSFNAFLAPQRTIFISCYHLSIFAWLDVFLVLYDECNDDYRNCVFFIPMKSAGYIKNAAKRITGGDTIVGIFLHLYDFIPKWQTGLPCECDDNSKKLE